MAVEMAEQVLVVNPRKEVTNFAKEISKCKAMK